MCIKESMQNRVHRELYIVCNDEGDLMITYSVGWHQTVYLNNFLIDFAYEKFDDF